MAKVPENVPGEPHPGYDNGAVVERSPGYVPGEPDEGFPNGSVLDTHATNSAVVGSSNAEPVAAADSGVPSSAGEAESGGGDRPPRGGPGSGLPEWLAYAADHRIDVPEDASRDDVIAAVEAAEA